MTAAVMTLADSVKRMRLVWYSARYCMSDIRISMSYLFRIKVDDDYFLVRGNRYKNQYQPVGGVFKRYPTAQKYLAKIGFKEDRIIPVDRQSSMDLRGFIPGRNINRFLRWFDLQRDREIGYWREWQEELIQSGILDANLFPDVAARYVGRHVNRIHKSEQYGHYSLLIAEVFEVILTDPQTAFFRELRKANSDNYKFAKSTEIMTLGGQVGKSPEATIARTAKWTLSV